MAERPDSSPDLPLTPVELTELRQRYTQLSTPSLQTAYAEALDRCKLDQRGRPPNSIHIQVLVQAWRILRKTKFR